MRCILSAMVPPCRCILAFSASVSVRAASLGRRCRSSICFWVFCKSVCFGANCDCNCACACFPSAVATMALRMLITAIFDGADAAAAAPCARMPRTGARHNTASTAKVPTERELTIILTPSLSSRKSQIADYSGPNSRTSIGNAVIVLIEAAAMQSIFQHSLRCTRIAPKLAALVLVRQGDKQDAPVRRVRDDGDIRKRLNIQRILQRSRDGQTDGKIGIARGR